MFGFRWFWRRDDSCNSPKDPFDLLGPIRLRLLGCTAPPSAPYPGGLALPEDGNVFEAYRAHAKAMTNRWGHLDDPNARALILALSLMSGDIAAADKLLDLLPEEPVILDHGAGVSKRIPFSALRFALPWPDKLAKTEHWLAGSDIEAKARAWLEENRAHLVWDDTTATFRRNDG